MRLYYYNDPTGNFGDDLNPWLWPRLFPRPIESYYDNETLFVGIGSILNHGIPSEPAKKLIFSSGFAYGQVPRITPAWKFICVRGPLTAKRLGLDSSLAITDGAVLVRRILGKADGLRKGVAFMPHQGTVSLHDWRPVCASVGVSFVDPRWTVDQVLAVIRNSKLVITESLHGAIVADALRVPWIPVKSRPSVCEFKWQDWALSLKMEHRFEWLPPIWSSTTENPIKRIAGQMGRLLGRFRLEWICRRGAPRLSSPDVLDSAVEALNARLKKHFA